MSVLIEESMTAPQKGKPSENHTLDDLYKDAGYWHVNLGAEKIHPKRMGGFYRSLKWAAASLYLLFFLGPFLRWEGSQAVLFDIPGRKYHLMGVTLWPQDIWILALALLTFFITLYAVTAIAGRVFCGYFCWQTVWTDAYIWIEEKIEGTPRQRQELDKAPWTLSKVGKKGGKTLIFLLLGVITGVTFTSYFIDVFDLWRRYLTLQGPVYIWAVPVPFIAGTYLGVGIMREQLCFWLCPYARIQGAMQDSDTVIPTYDAKRGEPRGRLKKGENGGKKGDCVDCNLCLAVCPTGVDIRNGEQEGCLMCALCLDACDSVMEKVGKPKGLIRYASLKEMTGVKSEPFFRRARVVIYLLVITAALSGIAYGLAHTGGVQLNVIHERQPLYVVLSDGGIQNKYLLKIVNKSPLPLNVTIVISELPGAELLVQEKVVHVEPGKVLPLDAVVRLPRSKMAGDNVKLEFHLADAATDHYLTETYNRFVGP